MDAPPGGESARALWLVGKNLARESGGRYGAREGGCDERRNPEREPRLAPTDHGAGRNPGSPGVTAGVGSCRPACEFLSISGGRTKAVILASTLATLWLATLARPQDVAQSVVVAFGDRYRVTAVNSSLVLVPEVPFTRKHARALPEDEKLSRYDEFVALALKSLDLHGPGAARLVRDRVEPRPEGRRWVLYAQRHQGYPILGAGGRIEVDSYGRVVFAGLTYETEKLRNFRPMDSAKLGKLAASALPHPRVGPPISHELMIDPLGDAPAQLRAYVVYQVRAHDRVERWQVILNAETGEVLDSFSLFMNAESPPIRASRNHGLASTPVACNR